jgi:hypothetical protein
MLRAKSSLICWARPVALLVVAVILAACKSGGTSGY